MKNLFFLLVFTISFHSFSQKISGFVFDNETNKPIEKAHIKVGKKVYLTNQKGFFSVYPKKEKSIFISHINYKTQRVRLKKEIFFKIYLKESPEELDEIKIIAKELQDEIQFTQLEDFPHSLYHFGTVLEGDKILIFAGDASFLSNSLEFEKNKILFTGTNDGQAFIQYASMPQFSDYISHKNDLLTYNIKENTWFVEKNKVRKRSNLSALKVNENVFLLGGKRKTRSKQYLDEKIEIYNLNKNEILVDDTNPHKAVNFASSVYKNKIIVSGGSTKIKRNGDKMYSNKVHFFDTDSGYWYELANMRKGKETKSIISDNKLYFFGGFRGKKLKEIESYDLKKDIWKTEGTLFKAMERPAIAKNATTIFLFEDEQLLTFNTKTKQLKSYQINLPLLAAEMYIKDTFLYIFGGYKNKQFTTKGSKKMVKVSLDEFEKTKVRNQKYL